MRVACRWPRTVSEPCATASRHWLANLAICLCHQLHFMMAAWLTRTTWQSHDLGRMRARVLVLISSYEERLPSTRMRISVATSGPAVWLSSAQLRS
ncbi:hypothetical protein K456DRAFT_1530664 [Colletotrichum gloeosporioides 23]|nr:hypothetical protein K456DRAFT_1530664 [Colletotrichum gloeosporioides 23]